MTPQEARSLYLDIVKNDAKIRGRLLIKGGETCQVGAMMLAIGLQVLIDQSRPTPMDVDALCKAFHLTVVNLRSIMSCNDRYDTVRDRRVALSLLANSLWLVEEPRVNV